MSELCWCGDETFEGRKLCQVHYERFFQFYTMCGICFDDFETSKRYGMQGITRNNQACNHWFCRDCICRYEPDFCVRCGKDIKEVLSLLLCQWKGCNIEIDEDQTYCHIHKEIFQRYIQTCVIIYMIIQHILIARLTMEITKMDVCIGFV
jgi:hypothetical protein